ncbi:MBL fold metallo-hydrolase [Oceanidesulfovibrio marinus]|uniref:MBL fold metallo-hydrolase n=1 Tax=Oceanidesulfovibrio marinus TaxID=370038 RepID=A0ABX6NEH4_9BACT|nr:MBL fold metallo-hydrolase [Oceanidesulfovibrio marinus]QJT08202.1 MBL fold metallo-hydrolase [Oceanidesulfovibrio marinus]
MRLVILSENTPSPEGLAGEHGLSLAVYLDDGSMWLWDAGASGLAAQNAAALHVDLAQAVGLALSHGHYDHTGGIAAFLEAGFDGPIFAHQGSTTPRWAVKPGSATRPIGWEKPEPVRGRIRPVEGTTVLATDGQGNPVLTMVTDIPRLPGNAEHVDNFFHDSIGERPDCVLDDACLVLHTPRGRVLVLGCCHSGLANTLAAVDAATAYATHPGSAGGPAEASADNADSTATPGFECVLGGLHLMGVTDADDPAILQALDALKRYGVRSLRPGHCTGSLAGRVLAERFPGPVELLHVGAVIEL